MATLELCDVVKRWEDEIRLGAVLRHNGSQWIVRGIGHGVTGLTLDVAPFPTTAIERLFVTHENLIWNESMGEWQTPSAFRSPVGPPDWGCAPWRVH